jgi:thioredoxin reductase (NADPH)
MEKNETQEPEIRDIVIAGSGPAGYTAAIYAARAGFKPLLYEGLNPGGQLTITGFVENYPGFENSISGPRLMNQMRAQAERFGAEIVADLIESVDLSSRPFRIRLSGAQVLAKTFIVATGAEAKWLGLPSEKRYRGRGVSACATCDGFFFKNQRVAVVGGGDTACEDALYLTEHANEVLLVHRRGELRASKIMADRALSHPKIKPVWHRVVEDVIGEKSGMKGLKLKDPRTGATEEVPVDGLFVAIGHQPSTEFLHGQLALDKDGFIITAPKSTATSDYGVFAAGDVQDNIYKQAITAAASGCMAAIEVTRLLKKEERQ